MLKYLVWWLQRKVFFVVVCVVEIPRVVWEVTVIMGGGEGALLVPTWFSFAVRNTHTILSASIGK